ncbi:MAG TPA: glutathione S-transferase family protein [Kofleriaceae bacterium]|nr:glutathione S-transferase family protein [Kofleriaceae bacterium]
MKLYDFPFSPNCRKVRAVAYEVGAPFEAVRVDLLRGDQRAPAHLARNPNGRVPVLEDGDLVLWESVAIMRYLAAGTALVPTERRAAAEMDRWLAWQLAHLAPAMSKVAFERVVKQLLKLGPADAAAVEAGAADFAAMTAVLEGALAGKEYVGGRLSLADFALAAHYSLAPACGLSVATFPAVESWLARVLARDSMKRALADAQALA